MDFAFTPEQSTFQLSVRELLAAIVDDDLHDRVHQTGVAHDRAFGTGIRGRGLATRRDAGSFR